MSYTELNDNAKKLVDALRSGKYQQEYGRLTTIAPEGDFDCCLGVACKVAKENGVEIEVREVAVGTGFGCKEYRRRGDTSWERMHLPTVVRDWLGFRTNSGFYAREDSLATANDNKLPFSKIADIIENSPGKNSLFE